MTDDTGAITEPLDVEAAEAEVGSLSYRQLIWRRFRRNRMGLIAGALLIVAYIGAVGAGFFAPYHYQRTALQTRHVPPQQLHLGGGHGLHVYGL
ncbi:hypothetical protein HOI71_15955, partial [Candidatus Poribacteria bacterium]|nr:hypothetical protein [Candidatus Poribacteria bacterium]